MAVGVAVAQAAVVISNVIVVIFSYFVRKNGYSTAKRSRFSGIAL